MKVLKLIVLSILFAMTMCIPVNAESMECLDNCGFRKNDERDFERIVEEILDIKLEHPEWSEQQVCDFLDQLHFAQRNEITDLWSSLTDSEKKLIICYPLDALKVNTARKIAFRQTEQKFGYNGLGDKSDAFRHGMWNAEMTILIGEIKAEKFATAHEDKDTTGTETDGYLKSEHKEMDLHNNAVGRKIGNLNLGITEMQMADIIYNSIIQEGTEFVWLHE